MIEKEATSKDTLRAIIRVLLGTFLIRSVLGLRCRQISDVP